MHCGRLFHLPSTLVRNFAYRIVSESFLRSMVIIDMTAKKATTPIMTLIQMAYCLYARFYINMRSKTTYVVNCDWITY